MKILLIGPYGIGNTILALPAMKTLRSLFPYAKIDLLTLLNSVYQMTNEIPDFKLFNRIVPVNFKKKLNSVKSILKLRKERYDYSILFFPSAKLSYNLLSFLCGAKKRVGSFYPDVNFRRGSFLNNLNIPVIIGIHDVYQNINLLSPFGADYKKINIKNNRSVLAGKKENIIGVHTGCKKQGYFKRWDRKKYLELIKKIFKYTDYQVKLFFGSEEQDDYRFFTKKLPKTDSIEFLNNLSLKELFIEIQKCKFFLSNDAGLMHISNFLGSHNLITGGPSDFSRTGPFNKPFQIIRSDLKCMPCSHTYFVCSHKFKCIYKDIRCMKNIKTETVWKEVKKLLE